MRLTLHWPPFTVNIMTPLLLRFVVLAFAITSAFPTENGDIEKRRKFMMDPENRAMQYQRAEEAFPFRKVHAGGSILKLERSSIAESFAPKYQQQGENLALTNYLQRTYNSALLILKNGKIVHESYRAGSSQETRFFSFSSAKSITSTLVGIALDDGLIKDIDDPLTQYLPSLIGSEYQTVSVKDALQMVAGIPFDRDLYDFTDQSNPFAKLHKESIIEQRYRFVEGANGLRRDRPVGVKFDYSTMNTAILGWLIETVSGKRLSVYMEEKLWKPGGMESDCVWFLDGPPSIGREMAGGNFAATLRDYGRFGLLFLQGGEINGRRLISADWVKSATKPNRAQLQYGEIMRGSRLGYGYHWWLHEDGSFTAEGVFGQFIHVVPQAGVVIVSLSHWPTPWDPALELENYAFFEGVVEAVR
jgi:CubicO group peptidase (beta-lactamase class C family)